MNNYKNIEFKIKLKHKCLMLYKKNIIINNIYILFIF